MPESFEHVCLDLSIDEAFSACLQKEPPLIQGFVLDEPMQRRLAARVFEVIRDTLEPDKAAPYLFEIYKKYPDLMVRSPEININLN